MKKILLPTVLFVVLTLIAAVLTGTLVWLIWPGVVPVVFPGLVANGILAGKLPWITAVGLCWLIGCLFKVNASAKTS